ncbi:unnamed protein product [Didymodactylos carnosus]|uniref:Uncharacterized protein n=1 Tax=Didymodactylos carnosus TaxID=1234261 RepID=A0A813XCE9_9BILA|nr:unnamed protein product [Didymodactylos carnosus]CAF0944947.1 unnamed protein product [Didymodactylos carnosus]CAF3650865.1 unnamed protein product [Didymodactylos carnosus]CAF3719640.1 unnamed protein product [Didymodactylos carnosus]
MGGHYFLSQIYKCAYSTIFRVLLFVGFLTCFYFMNNIIVGRPTVLVVHVTSTTSNTSQTSKTTITSTDVGNRTIEAFVTFSNNNQPYLALLNALLDSVHLFSTRPIIAFGIDVDLMVNLTKYPRVIKRQISQSNCGPSVYFCKLLAIVESNVDYGVLLETDDVVNYNVDILFDVLHKWPYDLPLSPRHPDDPGNQQPFMEQFGVVKKTTPYIHAHVAWTYRAYPFLRHVQNLTRSGHFQGANYDETAINVMLWKAKSNHTLCKYDPYVTYIDEYENPSPNCTRYCNTAFILLHGSKDPKFSSAVLKRLQERAGQAAIQTKYGLRHMNETNVTCCYDDSKPSPIHPLLCLHEDQ